MSFKRHFLASLCLTVFERSTLLRTQVAFFSMTSNCLFCILFNDPTKGSGGETSADAWSPVWAAVDGDCAVKEGVMLLWHFEFNPLSVGERWVVLMSVSKRGTCFPYTMSITPHCVKHLIHGIAQRQWRYLRGIKKLPWVVTMGIMLHPPRPLRSPKKKPTVFELQLKHFRVAYLDLGRWYEMYFNVHFVPQCTQRTIHSMSAIIPLENQG